MLIILNIFQEILKNIKVYRWTSLVAQWLRLCLPMQGVWVRSLVGELRSHMPHSPPQKKNPKSIKQKQYCNEFNKDFKK